ncbi:porin family protein [Sphingobacterium pedocola]|uniref:Aromatic hydrocarbon degradation protein n=1 Tax=Sphingobacterium pedocola TaxID=2082722 RepID=A0ABR9T4R9_9SPHI|nr:hypothetical protein [Sphingobacterium pedocola]MBE8719904.1 hypothetical protein [Sphingobacterium pedocola]
MYKKFKADTTKKAVTIIIGIGLVVCNLQVHAQKSTSHSPYSQFGLGQMREDLLPQTRSMAGIAAGVRYQAGLPILNISNPASYSAFSKTILEAGLYGNITQLGKGSATDNTADFAFSHIAIGIPLAKAGGIAFGLMPFSDVGYNSSEVSIYDTLTYKKSASGEGGVNKAFIGYGLSPIKGLSVGANVGFLFGNLSDIAQVEFPLTLGNYNARLEETRLIRGATIDYGVQYFKSLGKKMNITVGYSGTLNNTINSKSTRLVTRNEPSLDDDFQNIALDTSSSTVGANRKINLPLKHNIGFTLSKGYNWMVGADFKYTDWSDFQTREGEIKLGKNYGVAIGGQFKPDPTSVKYWNVVDYRLGFRYNQTQIRLNNNDIADMAVTVGLGLPLSETNFGLTFSRINISAEFGQQGTLNNNLVRERYININLGFTINDTWFRRRSYD